MSSLTLRSPIGPVLIAADGDRLASVRLCGTITLMPARQDDGSPLLREAAAQLLAWFEHRLTDFDLPLIPVGSLRGAVLREAIRSILYGETASYGAVARTASSGPRAIGQACRRNPYPIIIPCHRVTGAQQTIGHYSGGDGIATKRWLLAHEQQNVS